MKLRLPHSLLVALEHCLGDSPGLLAELKVVLGGELKPGGGPRFVAMDEGLVQRIGAAVEQLDKRAWVQPFFGPLTAAEIKQQWRAAIEQAESAAA